MKKSPLLLIISNNFGGGIFDYLPVAKSPRLDAYFTNSHPWKFEMAAKMFDIPYVQFDRSLPHLPDSGIVELLTDRKENHLFQKRLIEACSRAFV